MHKNNSKTLGKKLNPSSPPEQRDIFREVAEKVLSEEEKANLACVSGDLPFAAAMVAAQKAAVKSVAVQDNKRRTQETGGAMNKVTARDELRLAYAEKLLTEEEKADVRAKLPSSVDAIEMLRKELSGYDEDFSYGILIQLGALSITKDPHGFGFLFARSVLKEVRPGDRMGMLLVVQMLVLHDATMTQSGRLAISEDLPQTESRANMVNKFARTFAHQMDTLHKWRSAPEQKVTVNNFSVNDGGQAIVGHVTHTGGSGTNDVANPPPTLTDQSGTAMPIIQPDEQSATTVPRIEQDQEPAPSATRRRRSK